MTHDAAGQRATFGRRGATDQLAVARRPVIRRRTAEVSVDDELFRLFVGPNVERFETVREKMHRGEKSGSRPVRSWSWPGFLFPQVWLAYRKQWTLVVVTVVVPILAVYIFGDNLYGGVAISGFVGARGKICYVGEAERRIRKICALGLTATRTRERIRRAGGVSILAGVIGGLLYALLAAIALLAQLALYHHPA